MNFALVMDVSMLLLLAATVFLAGKLTFSLRNFKESRFEMEGLVNRLTSNIDKAERAVGGLQNGARNAGKELDEIIREARALTDELKFMNETGNNLANRLEKLAEKNRALMDKVEEAGGFSAAPITYRHESPAQAMDRELEEELLGGFAIHDREYEDDLEDDFDAPGLQSQAEREFFEALQNKTRQRKGAGGRQ